MWTQRLSLREGADASFSGSQLKNYTISGQLLQRGKARGLFETGPRAVIRRGSDFAQGFDSFCCCFWISLPSSLVTLARFVESIFDFSTFAFASAGLVPPESARPC